jgi:hypothetical protein
MLDDGCWVDCVVLPRHSVCIDGMSAKMPNRKILVGGWDKVIAFCLLLLK